MTPRTPLDTLRKAMHVRLFSLFLFFVLFACLGHDAKGDDSKQEADQANQTVTLKIGDAAPRISASKWFNCPEWHGYQPGKIYVIEVWATWCGPCILAMPHLDELARKHKSDGLEVIALTTADSGNTLDAVTKFVKGLGKDFQFKYAFCEDRETYDSFMKAAGKVAIPCSFVIDEQGKVAFIGMPTDLDYVISRLAAGTWRGQSDIDELKSVNESIGQISQLAMSDPSKALELIERAEKINPQRTRALDFASAKVATLTRMEKFTEAKAAIDQSKKHFSKSEDWGGVAIVSASLASRTHNPKGIGREHALNAMLEARQAAGDDFESLAKIAMAYRMCGDNNLFAECMEDAIKHCPNAATKAILQQSLEQIAKQKAEQE